jgi:uncharacterized linocin/CFP29 family protein
MGRSRNASRGRASLPVGGSARAEGGQDFWGGSSGRWAGERLLQALDEGRDLSTSELRALGTLRPYEWTQFDEVVVAETVVRLRAVADLIAHGLVKPVPNGLGRTVLQYDKQSDLGAAQVSLDGLAKSGNERIEWDQGSIPLVITHKDFFLNLRTLAASRNAPGEALDMTQARLAGRVVAEKVESMLLTGGPTFAGAPIYGYTTQPSRNTGAFGTNGAWSAAAKTGNNILDDVLTMISALHGDRFFGPYAIYVPTAIGVKLENDFKANSDLSIRQRLMQVDSIVSIQTCDQLTADNVLMVQLTEDVTSLVEGEPPQTIQWDIEGGMRINFKAMCIQVPLVRATKAGRSGIYHMS